MKIVLGRRMRSAAGAIAIAIVFAPGCGGGSHPDAAPQVDATPPAGTVSLSWKLTDGSASITCGDVGGLTVTVTLIPANGFYGTSQPFGCSDGKGTTDKLTPGTYKVTIELVSVAGDLAAPITMPSVQVTDGKDTNLGQVHFDVLRKGGISFSLSAGGGPNCSGTGAGIDQFTLELVKNGKCVPTTFTIPAGKTQGGATYASDCKGATTGCIETDQTVSVSGVTSGTYQLDITGDVSGSGACWQRASEFSIPGGNLVADLGELDLQPACTADGGVADAAAAPDGGVPDAPPPD